MNTLIIGPHLTPGTTRSEPLSPNRTGSPGCRLRRAMGLNLTDFRASFDTINLINERLTRWNYRHGQVAASALLQVCGGRSLLLLGNQVVTAFDMSPNTWLDGRDVKTVRDEWVRIIAVPRLKNYAWWDDNRDEFRTVMRTEGIL